MVGNRKTEKRNYTGEREQVVSRVTETPEVYLSPSNTTYLLDLKSGAPLSLANAKCGKQGKSTVLEVGLTWVLSQGCLLPAGIGAD